MWGGLCTILFYALIPYVPVHRDLVLRYFCGHWIEYVTVAFFFWSLAILGVKARRLGTERSALAADLLAAPVSPEQGDPMSRAAVLADRLRSQPAKLRRTFLGQRVLDVCHHVRGKQTTAGLEDHLKYLAELASERLHGSYALVRTITWAIPILGFLGTVIGITLAISNVTPEQLDSSLSEVTGGLGVAFDTTALSLALSLLLVFSAFMIEGAEGRVLAEVEDYGIQRLLGWFAPAAGSRRLVDAEGEASRRLLEKTESLIGTHTKLWNESLEGLRHRWSRTLESQAAGLNESLQQGTAAVLRDHAEQLSALRGEFLTAFQAASREMAAGMAETRAAQREQQQALAGEMQGLWERIRADLARLRDNEAERSSQLAESVAGRVGAWQAQLKESSDAATAQLDELRRQREALLQLVDGEQQLARLEGRLVENLEALRAAESFDETLHSLSAAVHLLTARARPKAA